MFAASSRRQFFVSFSVLLLSTTHVWAQTVSDPNINVSVLANGFSQPTGMAFLGSNPNDFFVIEKASGLVRRWNSGTTSNVLTLPVDTNSERGIIGITLDPQFNGSRPYAYVYYSQQVSGSWAENRLSRFTWTGSAFNPASEVRLLGFPSDGAQANGPNHNGGPIKFGADGLLYGTTGDLNRNRAEQNQGAASSSSQVGGIYRYDTSVVQANGTIVGDPFATNPFRSNANTSFHPWVAYGVRNSFGIVQDKSTGTMWYTENGPSQYDEINRLTVGMNSGWNKVMGPISRTGVLLNQLVDLGASSTYTDPAFSWLTTIGVTSMEFLNGSQWGPTYNNSVLVGDNNTGRLYRFKLNGTRNGFDFTGLTGVADLVADNATEVNQFVFGSGFSVITDIQVGPDGAVYIMNLGSGNILRLVSVPEPQVIIAMVAMTGMAGIVWYRRSRKPLDVQID
ncbi:MAG TPA: PQQ-dependent sugar dehydrogenase [Gemmatales bacterium]|nr:PQQ-dependent sugar dehydrogenase [Gemmatales bacterium]